VLKIFHDLINYIFFAVTSTAVPDVALSMMQERVKQYDLVMAAVQMRGMDCLTFLKATKEVSNIPVARTFQRTLNFFLPF